MSERSVVGIGLAIVAAAVGLCALASPLTIHPGQWILPVAGTALLVWGSLLVLVARHARRHSRLAAELFERARPIAMDGMVVHELDGLDGALVAGLRRPRIYCGRDLASRLTPEEHRAVLLHEQYHQFDRAPAKLIVLQAFEPFLRRLNAGRAWLARRLAGLEIAADRHALAVGTSREALASALYKLSPASHATVGIGFASATDLRLIALLDEEQPPQTRIVSARWLLAPTVAAAACVLLILPV